MKDISALAADSNVLISSILGGRAYSIITKYVKEVSFYTTDRNLSEVEKFITVYAEAGRISYREAVIALKSLPVIKCEKKDYYSCLRKAGKIIGQRDRGDMPLLALAIDKRIPIWSNDKDFTGVKVVQVFTTGELVKVLPV